MHEVPRPRGVATPDPPYVRTSTLPDSSAGPGNTFKADALAARFRTGATILAALTGVIGAMVLAGWLARIDMLKSLSPDWVAMKANTALCLCLAAIAAALLNKPRPTPAITRCRRICALAVVVVGGLTIGEYLFGQDLRIDQLLFREAPGAIGTSAPGRMAFSSAVCFVLIGGALFLFDGRRGKRVRFGQCMALVVALMGTLSLLGYVYSVPAFEGVITYSPMAVHTAAGFVFLGTATLMSTSRYGFMRVISSPASGGIVARRLLPVVVSLPPLLGVLRILGARAGWFPARFGISLKDGVVIVLLAVIIWISARRANRLDEAQQELMTEREAAVEWLQAAHGALQITNQEMTKAKSEADRANQAKSEFLSRMSHELRTPLNAILGFAQLLEMDDLDKRQRESVEEISRGGRHLLSLTNEILDLARIESGRLSLSLEPVPLGDVLDECIALVRPLAEDAGIELRSTRSPVWDRFVLADQQRLRQVVLNLLSNAVKYNHRDGSIAVACESDEGGRVRINVTDSGPGIDESHQEDLFEPFERLGAEQTEVEGTGLGLALSKRLAEAMGGGISLFSSAGRGSTFTVELRGAESPLELQAAMMDESPSHAIGDGCVVYIEDNRPNLLLVQRALSRHPGIQFLAATTAEAGLELVRARLPDVVLVDLNLPDGDGEQVLSRLREDAATRTIPVVVVSADATSRRVKDLLAAGADAYITKPIDLKQLVKTIEGLMPVEVTA